MATQALQQIRYLHRQGGNGCRLSRGGEEERSVFKEDASQSFKAGELVYLADSDGKVAVATASSKIAGQTREAATGTEDEPVKLWPIHPDDVFVANVYHATAASAVTALAQLGDVFPIKVVSNKWHVDIENTGEDGSTSNARVKVIGFWDEDAIGDIYGRVLVQFLGYSLATDGNPNTRILQLAGG